MRGLRNCYTFMQKHILHATEESAEQLPGSVPRAAAVPEKVRRLMGDVIH
jgi:hypothetical protein